jgi:hypothetical protein
MDIFESVQEATTKQLQRKQKSVTRLFPEFPGRVKAVADKGGIRLKSAEPELWNFKIHSGTKKDVWYDAYLKFKNIVPTLQRIVKDRRLWVKDKSRVDRTKLARKFMDTVDVQIKCSCPAFQYWGPAYILSLGKYDAKHTDRELRPPRKRNPKQYGAFCKHLQNLMRVLPFYTDTAMEWITDFYDEDIKKAEAEAREEYGWVKKVAKKLKKKKKEKEEEPEEKPEEEEETEDEQEEEETKESKIAESVEVNWSRDTDLPMIDQWMKDPEYALKRKGKKVSLVWMTPEEYLFKQAEVKGVTLSQDLRAVDKGSVDWHKERMLSGDKVFSLYLEPAKEYQEGRHRAVAAKELGVKRVPVVVVEEVK